MEESTSENQDKLIASTSKESAKEKKLSIYIRSLLGNVFKFSTRREPTQSEKLTDQYSSYYLNDANELQQDQNGTLINDGTNQPNDMDDLNAEKELDDEVQFDLNETNQIECQDLRLQEDLVDDNSNLANLNSNENVVTQRSNFTRQESVVKNDELKNSNKKLISSDPGSKNCQTAKNLPVETSAQHTSLQPPLYYELRIKLKEGKNLAVRDLSGTSDPYAKFLLNGQNVYKSKIIFKNLNPQWHEEFTIKLLPSSLGYSDSVSSFNNSTIKSESAQLEYFLSKFQLKVFVYDYDRGFLSDDLIGYGIVGLAQLKENIETEVQIELEDEKLANTEYLGLIELSLNLIPKYSIEELANVPTHSKLSSNLSNQSQKQKKTNLGQLWQSVVNIVLIEGNNFLSVSESGFSDPYVKFKLENEKYRSKIIRKTANPRFLEQFQLYNYNPNKMVLNISVYDYDSSSSNHNFIGKANVDLKLVEAEKTHFLKVPLEDGAGTVSLLITITGTYGIESSTDLDFDKEVSTRQKDNIIRKYGLFNSFKNLDDVGWLQVKVLRAEGLPSADINGKSDPFCSLQLVNQYAQTQTEYKTLNPEWGKVFEFKVNDIHAILEITVLDEDKNKVYEFLGKVEIPLINIENGKKRFYALKDRKHSRNMRGAIELEMSLIYNPVKAIIRTFNPREEKYLPVEAKLKVPVLKQNLMRVHNLLQKVINAGVFVDSCFRWINPLRSIIAFIIFLVIVLSFEVYMLPLILLMLFLKNLLILRLNGNCHDETGTFEFFEEEEEDPENRAPKKTFIERLNDVQEISLKVQETLDKVASLGERIVNTFNFSTPWLSWLAVSILIVASVILYYVPLRYLILVWGVNKFTKKFRKPPGYVDNTEILDFLSRVPSKKDLFTYRELRWDYKSSNSLNSIGSNSNLEKKKKKQ